MKMSVGLNEFLNFSVIVLLVFAYIKLKQESKRINELNKRLTELEMRVVVRVEDRITTLEQEAFNQIKINVKSEV